MAKRRTKFRYSVQLTFFLIFGVFTAVTIGMLNSYPTMTSRDVVASTKQSALLSQVATMSASLSALERLSEDGTAQVMELLDVGDYDRVIVTDEGGKILYDTERTGDFLGQRSDFSEVRSALDGAAVFYCNYDGAAFHSRAAAPVMSYGSVIGAVYLQEADTNQAELINSIQSRLREKLERDPANPEHIITKWGVGYYFKS